MPFSDKWWKIRNFFTSITFFHTFCARKIFRKNIFFLKFFSIQKNALVDNFFFLIFYRKMYGKNFQNFFWKCFFIHFVSKKKCPLSQKIFRKNIFFFEIFFHTEKCISGQLFFFDILQENVWKKFSEFFLKMFFHTFCE